MHFNNCSPNQEERLYANHSPFEETPLIIAGQSYSLKSSASTSDLETAQAVVQPGTMMSMIVNDICLNQRAQNLSRKIKYFTEAALDDSSTSLTPDPEKFHESLLRTRLQRGLTVANLKNLMRADPCIIGLTDHQEGDSDFASYNDPEYSRQQNLNQTQHSALDLKLSQLIGPSIRVRVATFDTGYNLASREKSLIAPYLDGSDFINC